LLDLPSMTQKIRHRVATGTETPGWTFFRQWLKNPLAIAAISPSSRQLARQMVSELPPNTRRVIELGGGTGVFTQALLEHGIVPADLMVLELNEELHQHLRRRFADAHVVCGDARDLPAVAARSGYSDAGPADAVISGLGLLSMSKPMQRAIVEAAFATLRPDGRLIQFTYGPASPVAREVLDALDLNSRRGNFAWWNMPPATVYVYTRNRSRAVKARSMR
jgi:phosphatidylethanolamine/phosphatidyl-N-methylethanolamine N-methyltransferase